ncbi:YwmB family TATA-box binding protein [Paenibacillus chibensis]|uniref:YwmB family TATA-box binding protein n=1 Tax=Paenibacillus chibensis TaxID=59846 RepID=A0ABU6Q1C3_9BACL|nr:YwmB family TATA-box binding protein [Paenibacillus chibensis]
MKATAKLVGFGLLCITVLGFMWGDFWNGMTQAEAKEADELHALLELGQQTVDQPLKVVVKWQGEWDGSGTDDAKAAAQKLSQSLELPPVSEWMENGHTTYRVLDEKNKVGIRFNWQEISAEQSYIIIQLEAGSSSEWANLSDLQKECGTKMRAAGIDAKWNASLQGLGNKEENPAALMDRIEGSLERTMDAVPMETYQDATTVSNAYQVPSLTSRIRSGSTWLNMQVAVHEDETTGENRVTIGLPVITIEY